MQQQPQYPYPPYPPYMPQPPQQLRNDMAIAITLIAIGIVWIGCCFIAGFLSLGILWCAMPVGLIPFVAGLFLLV